MKASVRFLELSQNSFKEKPFLKHPSPYSIGGEQNALLGKENSTFFHTSY